MKLNKWWHREFFSFCGRIYSYCLFYIPLVVFWLSYVLFIMRETEGAPVFIHTSYLINGRSKRQKLFSYHKPRTRQGELGRSEVNQDPSLQCLSGQFPQLAVTSQYNDRHLFIHTSVLSVCTYEHQVCAGARDGQKRGLGPLQLELNSCESPYGFLCKSRWMLH